ncbi:hypothetical protein HKD37_13G036888 [Glycine soja]
MISLLCLYLYLRPFPLFRWRVGLSSLKMATGVTRKISAASARAHTRRAKKTNSLPLPSGILGTALAVLFIGFLAWAYQVIQPPPPKICGTPDGPPITAPRIKLRDGRHLAYKEHGVPKDAAKYKIISVHGFNSCRHDAVIADTLSPDVVEELGIYIVSFDRPGYGESDPDPNRTLKSIALDIQELADQLGLGSKFYVVGVSMGGQVVWNCLKYIPHRLTGAVLVAPVVNYWWPGLPANLTTEAYDQQKLQDQWALRVAHYVPWLTYWWNTQRWFPGSSVIAHSPHIFSHQDKELLPKLLSDRKSYAHFSQHAICLPNRIRDNRWRCWWLALTWAVWQQRNKIIFSNETFDGNKVMEDAIFILWTWMRSFEKDFALPYSYWSTNISSVFAQVIQQGDYETIHRDINIGFGNWEYSPLDLENPFPNNEGSVHLWQGDEDMMVPVTLQRYIAQNLPWINYHELQGSGHIFAHADGMSDTIIKSLLRAK